MAFGYFPDYKNKSVLKDIYLQIFGYPYPPRRNEARLVFKLLKPRKNEKILDVGCGDGIWTNELAKKSFNVTGIDISRHDLKKAQKRAQVMGLDVNYNLVDATNMPFDTQSFDKIFSISTLEHIQKDEAVLKECHRILKPNGSIVISVPQKSNLLLPKFFVKLPKRFKKHFLSELIVNSKNIKEYQKQWNNKFRQYRTYKTKSLERRLKSVGFTIEHRIYHCNVFGKIPQNLLESFKMFQWKKTPNNDYKFQSESAHALTFPIFYPFYLLDDLFPSREGRFIIINASKAE